MKGYTIHTLILLGVFFLVRCDQNVGAHDFYVTSQLPDDAKAYTFAYDKMWILKRDFDERLDCYVIVELTNSSSAEALTAYRNYINEHVLPTIELTKLGQAIALLEVDSVFKVGQRNFSTVPGNLAWVTGYKNFNEILELYAKPNLINAANELKDIYDDLGLSQFVAKCSQVELMDLPNFDPLKETQHKDSIVTTATKAELVHDAVVFFDQHSNGNTENVASAMSSLGEHSDFETKPFFFVHTFAEAHSDELIEYRLGVLQSIIPYGIVPVLDLTVFESNAEDQNQPAWNEITIIRWPSRRVFLSAVTSKNYQAGYGNRAKVAENAGTFSRVTSQLFPPEDYLTNTSYAHASARNHGVVDHSLLPCAVRNCYGPLTNYFGSSLRNCLYYGKANYSLPLCLTKSIVYDHPTWEPITCIVSHCLLKEVLYIITALIGLVFILIFYCSYKTTRKVIINKK